MRKLTLIVITFSLLLMAGCNAQSASTGPLQRGVSFSPSSLGGPGIADFFAKSPSVANVVSWQGDWNDIGNVNSGIYLVLKSALGNLYTPIIVLQVFNQADGKLIRPIDSTNTESYLLSISKLASDYKPQYLGIGVEVNLLSEASSTDFDSFVTLFNKAVDTVKKVSPNTAIFTTFQLEHMKGLRGGLFGGTSDTNQTQWDLLQKFSKADFFAFSSYPSIIYNNPADIPNDYYSDIGNHTNKLFAISETGWFRKAPEGWDGSSATEQADFINRLSTILLPASPRFLIWSFMYDPPVEQPVFSTMGLLSDQSQTTSPAWDAWQKLK